MAANYARMEPASGFRNPLPLLNAMPGRSGQPLVPAATAAQTLGGDIRQMPNTPASFWEALNARAGLAQPAQSVRELDDAPRTAATRIDSGASAPDGEIKRSNPRRDAKRAARQALRGATPATPEAAAPTIASQAPSPMIASAPAFTGERGYTRSTVRRPSPTIGMT